METVEYRELFSDNFNNYTVGGTRVVIGTYGGARTDTFQDLKKWVQEKLKEESSEYISLGEEIYNLRMEIIRLEKIKIRIVREIRQHDKTLVDIAERPELPF